MSFDAHNTEGITVFFAKEYCYFALLLCVLRCVEKLLSMIKDKIN